MITRLDDESRPGRTSVRLTLLVLMLCAAVASAQDLFPRFSIGGGMYLGDFATDIRADLRASATNPTALGTDISLERDLGLDPTEQLARFELQWRPFRRHEFSAAYFSTSRHGLLEIERAIHFEDEVYPIRAQVATDLALDYWEVAYTGWVRRSERYGFGLTLALLGLSLEATLTGSLPDFSQSITEGVEAMAPVALIGARGRLALTPRLVAEASVAALPQVNYDVYSAQAIIARGILEYRVTRSVSVGAAYNYFLIEGTFDDLDFTGRLDLDIDGAEAHVRFLFGR